MTATITRKTSVATFAVAQATALSGRTLREKFSTAALDRACARGDVVRLLPGVYAAAVHATAFSVRAQAASMWARGPVSGLAALFLWGLLDEPPATIEVLVPETRKLSGPPWVKMRRSGVEVPQTLCKGIPVVSPAAAVATAYSQLPPDRRSGVVYQAVHRKLAGVRQLEVMAATIPRIASRKVLERSIAAAAQGARSWLEEHALYKVFHTAEFAGFVRQHELVIEGNQFFLDMFEPANKVAVELDGRDGHTDEGRQKNIERDCWVATLGIVTLRFSYWDLVERPEWCRRMVLEAIAARADAGAKRT